MVSRINLLFIFSVPAPYIVARLAALQATKKFNVSAIFMSNVSATYSWEMSTDIANLQSKFIVENQKIYKFSSFFQIFKLFRAILKNPAQNVFVAGYATGFSLYAILFSKILRKKLYLMSASSYQDYKRIWIKEYLKKRILIFFSGAIVGGGRQRKYLQSLGFDNSKIALGYNVVDQDFFFGNSEVAVSDKLNGLPDSFFLVVARLVEKKNILNILQAYKIYSVKSQKKIPLVISGDGPLLTQLMTLAKHLEIDDLIYFTGFLQQNDLRCLYKKAVCLVLFSKSEQWGLVVNEAIASNVNVIVSSACGCAESLVEHGINGFIVDPDSYVSLAKYMILIDENFLDQKCSAHISNVTDSLYRTELFCMGIEYLVEYSDSY